MFHAKSAGDQQGQQAINSPSLFGKPSGQGLFGGSSAPPSNSPGLLGAKPQSSVFAGNPSVFGGSQQSTPGLFGGAGASSSGANKPVFGGQATLSSSTFGAGGTSGSTTFGNAAQTPTTPSGIFGGSSQGQSSSLFGGGTSSTPGVAQPSSGNIFGGNPQNIFGRTSQGQPSLFGGMAGSSQGSVFGAAQGTGIFSGAANKPGTPTATATEGGVFGGQQGLLGAHPQQQSSLFGKPPASTPGVFGGSAPVPASTAPLNSGTSIFGGGAAQSTNSVFGGGGASTPTATSGGMGLFGGTTLSKPDTPGTGIFGGAASSAPGLFGQPPENPLGNKGGLLPTPPASQLQPQFLGFDPAKGRQNVSQVASGDPVNAAGNKAEWYTPLEQLQPHDREQFEADTFTVLPLCAPPLKYCF